MESYAFVLSRLKSLIGHMHKTVTGLESQLKRPKVYIQVTWVGGHIQSFSAPL